MYLPQWNRTSEDYGKNNFSADSLNIKIFHQAGSWNVLAEMLSAACLAAAGDKKFLCLAENCWNCSWQLAGPVVTAALIRIEH